MLDISSWFILSFSFLSSLLTTLTQVTGEQCSCCVFVFVSMRGYAYHLIQPWATSVACRLSVSSLTLMSSHNLFVCLRKLPCCPHNVRQSIIIWPTYLPRLPTALLIHPLACTVSISDLPLSLEKKNLLCFVLPNFINIACLAITISYVCYHSNMQPPSSQRKHPNGNRWRGGGVEVG